MSLGRMSSVRLAPSDGQDDAGAPAGPTGLFNQFGGGGDGRRLHDHQIRRLDAISEEEVDGLGITTP